MQHDELCDSMKSWLMDNDNWLMVVDNADDYVDFFGREDQSSDDAIYNSLPQPRPQSAMIIYTSRHTKIGGELTGRDCLMLGVMPSADALALLQRRLGRPIDEEIAIRLLDVVEYLPMSITHSAAYINSTGISIDEYLSMLEKSDEGLLDMLSQTVRDSRKDLDAPRSVVNTWLVTFDLLWRQSTVAANLFCFMACLDRHSTPKSLITLATSTRPKTQGAKLNPQEENLNIELPKSVGDLHSAFGELEAFALIKRGVDRESFSMHRYVQAITVRQLSIDNKLFSFSTLAANCVLAEFPVGTECFAPCHEPDMEVARQLAPTAYRVQSLLKEVSGTRSKARKTILHKLGCFYFAWGVLRTATDIFAELAKEYGSEDEPENFVWWQSFMLLMHGAFDEAQDIALQNDFDIDGFGLHFSNLVAMDCHYSRGEYCEVEPLARAMLAWISDDPHGDDLMRGCFQAYLAGAIGGYGITTENAREIDDLLAQAEKQLAGAPNIMQETLFSPHLTGTLLCAVYTDLQRYSDAERMYTNTIHAATRTFGSKHFECLKMRANRLCMQIDHLAQTDNLDGNAINAIERELRELYDHVTAAESSAGSAGWITCHITSNLARSVWLRAGYEISLESQKADCDLTRAFREYEARLKEAAQYSRDALSWSYHRLGALSRQAVVDAVYLVHILISGQSEEAAIEVVKHHAMLSTKALSDGNSLNPLDTYCLKAIRDLCTRHEQCHSHYVILLRSNLIRYRIQGFAKEIIKRERERVCAMLERMQTRQILLATNQQNSTTTDLTIHTAFCDLCGKVCILIVIL